MRAQKEEMVVEPCDLSVPLDRYVSLRDQGLKHLTDTERVALNLRFCEPLTIAQVADHMGLTWYQADYLIDKAVAKMRRFFREQLQITA
jgi:DNA-directed RNA polymerase specialized sigma subunit